MMTFEDALVWHKQGKAVSPIARSVRAVQVIIDLLDDYLDLSQNPDSVELRALIEKHK